MGQGSGSAIALGLALVCLIVFTDVATAATYTVGDRAGWTFNTVGWPRGKRFRAGDVLTFNYSPSIHNLVPVNADGYKNCRVPRGAKKFASGNERITLRRGTNYFICSIPGHCSAGMKIAVTAA